MKTYHQGSCPTLTPPICNQQLLPYIVPGSFVKDEKVQEEDYALSFYANSFDGEIIGNNVVYALHAFFATVEGQISIMTGDKLTLVDDTNAYWWLVRRFETSITGYVPAENIETPSERLARYNKIRNTEVNPVPSSEPFHQRSKQKRVSMSNKVLIQSLIIHTDVHNTQFSETFEETYGSIDNPNKEITRLSNHALSVGLTQHYMKHHSSKSLRQFLSTKFKSSVTTREQNKILRIYAGNLGGHIMFNSVLINSTTTGTDLLLLALERFRLTTKKNGVEYYLTVKVLDEDEIALSPHDKPLAMIDSFTVPHPRSSRTRLGLPHNTSFNENIGIRFLLNKRIKCVNEDDSQLRIKIAYYTPTTQPTSFRFARWYRRFKPPVLDRVEKLIAVPERIIVSDLTCLALAKFNLPSSMPYTCHDETANKYGMTLVFQDQEHVLNGQRRIMDILIDPWLNPKGKEDQVLFVLRKMQSRVSLEDDSVPSASSSNTSSPSSSLSDSPLGGLPGPVVKLETG